VVLLTAEESEHAVIRPRMRIMGADLSRVRVLDPDDAGDGFSLPAALDDLAAEVRAAGAGLVIVDTGPAFLDSGLRSNTEEHVRAFLKPLGRLGNRHDCLVLVLAHLNQGTGRPSRHRVMGGAAWVNAPRSVLLVGAPPEVDPRQSPERLVALEKSNLAPYPWPPAVAWRLAPNVQEPSWAGVVWGGEVEGVTPDTMLSVVDDETAAALDEATEFLWDHLGDGEWHASADAKEKAKKKGIGGRKLQRALRRAGVEVDHRGFPAVTVWRLKPSDGARTP
jgi:hypothetical protein